MNRYLRSTLDLQRLRWTEIGSKPRQFPLIIRYFRDPYAARLAKHWKRRMGGLGVGVLRAKETLLCTLWERFDRPDVAKSNYSDSLLRRAWNWQRIHACRSRVYRTLRFSSSPRQVLIKRTHSLYLSTSHSIKRWIGKSIFNFFFFFIR